MRKVLDIDMDAERLPDERRAITIATVEGPREVNATVYGAFALHLHAPTSDAPDPKPGITLTHLKTGYALFSIVVTDAEECLLFMESLIAALELLKVNWDFMDINQMSEDDRLMAFAVVNGFMLAYNTFAAAA